MVSTNLKVVFSEKDKKSTAGISQRFRRDRIWWSSKTSLVLIDDKLLHYNYLSTSLKREYIKIEFYRTILQYHIKISEESIMLLLLYYISNIFQCHDTLKTSLTFTKLIKWKSYWVHTLRLWDWFLPYKIHVIFRFIIFIYLFLQFFSVTADQIKLKLYIGLCNHKAQRKYKIRSLSCILVHKLA